MRYPRILTCSSARPKYCNCPSTPHRTKSPVRYIRPPDPPNGHATNPHPLNPPPPQHPHPTPPPPTHNPPTTPPHTPPHPPPTTNHTAPHPPPPTTPTPPPTT